MPKTARKRPGKTSAAARSHRAPALCAALLASCSVHAVDPHPAPPLALPAAFATSSPPAGPARWWQSFEDPKLDELIRLALSDSPRMRVAWARLHQAEALSAAARAPRWPTVDVNASAAYRENFFPPFGTIDQKTFALSMPVAYEIDVWNKYGAGVDGAAANVRATRSDTEAVAVSLAAEVAEAYYDLVNTQALDKLLGEQQRINTTLEELLQMRFERGVSTAVDVYQQRQQRLVIDGQRALLAGQKRLASGRLSVLLARSTATLGLEARAELPTMPMLSGLGVPADLLERRPDLRAARERIVAQDAQLAQAIAARLPSLVVNGSLSFNAISPSDLFESLLRSISGTVSTPLFDGGKRNAETRRQRALLEETVASYANVLLTALNEVDNALALEEQQNRALEVLAARKETAESSLREARARYERGLSDYLPVLTALSTSQEVERAVADATRQRLSARIQLCRALGGTWTAALVRPPPPG